MKIAIYSRTLSDNHAHFVDELLMKLFQKNIEVLVFYPLLQFLNNNNKLKTFKNSKELEGVDYMFSIGGDGTLLESVSYIKNLKIPILGINTGRLGFLTSVSLQEIEEAIKSILTKDFDLDTRSLLEVELKDKPFGNLNFALN